MVGLGVLVAERLEQEVLEQVLFHLHLEVLEQAIHQVVRIYFLPFCAVAMK